MTKQELQSLIEQHGDVTLEQLLRAFADAARAKQASPPIAAAMPAGCAIHDLSMHHPVHGRFWWNDCVKHAGVHERDGIRVFGAEAKTADEALARFTEEIARLDQASFVRVLLGYWVALVEGVDNLEINEAERASQRELEDYYGGSSPVTHAERTQVLWGASRA